MAFYYKLLINAKKIIKNACKVFFDVIFFYRGCVNPELTKQKKEAARMKANELRGKITARGMKVGEFCKRFGFVRCTFDRKLNGRSEFDRREIERIIAALDLTQEETRNIFFTNEVA